MAGDVCQIFFLECLLICVCAYCENSDQGGKCLRPKELICVPDECGNSTYICEDPFPVEPGKCPYFDRQRKKMDVTTCTDEQRCPNEPYLASSLVQKSEDCLGKPKRTYRCHENSRTTETTTRNHSTRHPQAREGSSTVAIVVPTILVILVIAILILVVFHHGFRNWVYKHILRRMSCIRNQQRAETMEDDPFLQTQGVKTPKKGKGPGKNDSPVDSTKKLEAVKALYSLVLFLKELPEKRNINIKQKIKEAKLLYKKSFIDDLSKDELQCLESGDFKALTNSTIYIFLTNLCDFEMPTRGWENPPLKNDVSLENDIARIRTLWNDMCDGDVKENLIKETFERLRNDYGEIPIACVENIGPKEKINWKQLKPDCEVDEGVVLTEKVKSIIQKLEEGELVVCTGVIGSGKSEALKYVVEKYRKDGWKVEWVEKIPLSTDKQNESGKKLSMDKQKVLLCCDNLFGDVAYENFTLEQLKSVKALLDKSSQCGKASKTKKFKLLVSIHKHVLQELENDQRESFELLKNYNITVEMDDLTSAELYLIFKETVRREGMSNEDSDFSSLETKLKNHSGKIGNPFLLMVFAKHRTIFADETFPDKPFHLLVENFKRLRTEVPKSFYILVYILIVRKHHKGNALEEWAQELSSPLSKEDLDDITKTDIAAYLDREGDIIRFSHEMFQIALFQCMFIHEIDMKCFNDPVEMSVNVDKSDMKHRKISDQCKDLILKTGHPFKRYFESETTLVVNKTKN